MATNAKIFRINYKSDFILTLTSDAGWMTPFCIKFWTSAPSQAYYVGWDGTTYDHCSYDPSEPTKLQVQFDDHHLPIGDLMFQVAYHFTVADFPNDTEDEVLNQANITVDLDGEQAKVMLDFTGETAPEIQFALPAYANEAQRIANEQQRIANEQTRIQNEESRIAAETIRQQNEAQRIRQEEARVSEFAKLKLQSQDATSAANTAAALANEKAALAADKAALAGAAATLANAKAQLAADKAALAASAAQLANDKAALAQQKAEYAQQQGDYAKAQGDTALADHRRAESDHTTAADDHTRAESDHGIAADDHTQAGNDHTRAESDHGIAADDHTRAGNDHTRAESDHGIAADDHTQAGNDHTRAESDHGIAADDHTQAGNDHTRAESDHTRAEQDHTDVQNAIEAADLVYDISKANAVGGVLATYADLSAALGVDGANVPVNRRQGGMTVKFVLTSDNKYVQFRYILPYAGNTTTENNKFVNPVNWQGVDNVPTAGSENLVTSGGVYYEIKDLLSRISPQVNIVNREQSAVDSGNLITDYPIISGHTYLVKVRKSRPEYLSITTRIDGTTTEIDDVFVTGSGADTVGVDMFNTFTATGDSNTIRVWNNASPNNSCTYSLLIVDLSYIKGEVEDLKNQKADKTEVNEVNNNLNNKLNNKLNKEILVQGRSNFEATIGKFHYYNGSKQGSNVNLSTVEYYLNGAKEILVYMASDLSGSIVQWNASKVFISNITLSAGLNQYTLDSSCAYVALDCNYTNRGYSSTNKVDESDYTIDDFYMVNPYIPMQPYNSLKHTGFLTVNLVNGSAANPRNANGVTNGYKVIDVRGCKKIKVVTTRPIQEGHYYFYGLYTFSIYRGEAYYSQIAPSFKIRETETVDNVLSLNDGEVGFAFTIWEKNENNVVEPLRYTDFENYETYVECIDGDNIFGCLDKKIDDVQEEVEDVESMVSSIYPEGSIFRFNNPDLVEESLLQLKRPNRQAATTSLADTTGLISLLHFSDVHGDEPNIERILQFKEKFSSFITDIIHTGDCVYYKYSHGNPFAEVTGAGTSILNIVGNHDAQDEDGHYTKTAAECYSAYMANYIASWGVTYEANKCYYYKDYTTGGIRLICLDCMHYDADQELWFTNTLESARVSGLSVIVASHYPLETGITPTECTFTPIPDFSAYNALVNPKQTERLTESAANCVDTFITNGGDFISWICGHTHIDCVGVVTGHVNQTILIVENAGNYNVIFKDIYNTSARVVGTKTQDAFNIVVFDKTSKLIKICRIGSEYDLFMRKHSSLCFKYDTKTLISD